MTRIWTQFNRKTAPLRRALRYRNRKPISDACNSADTILLASSGRSGSTFLAGLLNWDNEYRYLFEPMHPQWVNEFKGFSKRPYLPSGTQNETLLKTVSDSFSGQLSNPWIDQFNGQRHPSRRLVKAIRGNLALPGFSANHPQTRIIYLIRNPLAQALSVIGGSWKLGHEAFTQQPEFQQRYPALCSYLENSPTDSFLSAITFWCVENFVPFNEIEAQSIHFVNYENLISDPRNELKQLFEFIGKDFDEQVLELVNVRSKTSRPTDKGSPLLRWQTKLTQQQQDQALSILADFGLHNLYNVQGMPVMTFDQVQAAIGNNPFAAAWNATSLAGGRV